MGSKIELGTVVARITTDEVVNAPDLRRAAGFAAVREDPKAFAAALTPQKALLTPVAASVFDSFSQTLGTSEAEALKVLSGRVAVDRQLPAWVPKGFDFQACAAAAKEIMISEGEPASSFAPGAVRTLISTDGDLTLKKTHSPVLLKSTNPATPYLFMPDPRDPSGQTPLFLNQDPASERDFATELTKLKAEFPNANWDGFKAVSFDEFNSVESILRTPSIPEDVALLKASNRAPTSRAILNTARSGDAVAVGFDWAMKKEGVDLNGEFMVNNPAMMAKLGLTDPALRGGQKKALVNAAVILAFGAENIQRFLFLDDTDSNLIPSMQLLPQLFPRTHFEFRDVIEGKRNTFKQKLVAVADVNGELAGPDRKPLSAAAIASYRGKSAGTVLDPMFQLGH